MPWTWEMIRDEWLCGSVVDTSPAEVLSAFDLCEELLGLEWVQSQGLHGGARVTGSHPVAAVISMGKRLAAVRNAFGLDTLLHKIRSGDESARAELTAAYLCMPVGFPVVVGFGVATTVGNRERVPDFRLRRENDPWVYVEVTAPDTSEAQRQAQALLHQLSVALVDIPLGSMAEVMIRRDPSEEEMADILNALRAQARGGGRSQRDLPGLALILVGHGQPGQIVLDDHGEPNVPRIGVVATSRLEGEARKHLALRYAFSDQRAEAFLTSEARQLPHGTPGLVMVNVARASGAFKTWEPLLVRRLQPRQHTRVSGIALFTSGMWPLPGGEAWVPWTLVLENPHAANPAPRWLLDRLRSWNAPH
jgi:hypothetical protein